MPWELMLTVSDRRTADCCDAWAGAADWTGSVDATGVAALKPMGAMLIR